MLDAAADGAGDEDVTPAQIAAEVRAALEVGGGHSSDTAQKLLREALDAVSDGLSAEHVSVALNAALLALERAPAS